MPYFETLSAGYTPNRHFIVIFTGQIVIFHFVVKLCMEHASTNALYDLDLIR